MKNKVASTCVAIFVALVAYFCLWPVPVEPVSWNASASDGYVGAYAPNTKLAGLTIVKLIDGQGPEHIVLGADNKLYTGVSGGIILRMNPDGSEQEIFAKTDGRVLGLDFDANGNLIVADAYKGLLLIAPDGEVTLLTDRAGGKPFGFANAVVVAGDGRIYLSDSTTRFPPAIWDHNGMTENAAQLDILEQSATGRIIEYDPSTRSTRVVASGLSFANGIALSDDQQYLLVNESGRYRVWKLAVSASDLDLRQETPQASVLLDNLPGFPDNLMRGLDGKFWVGLYAPRVSMLDSLANKPFWRKVALRLPRRLRPRDTPYGHVFAFNEEGEIVADLQDPSGSFPKTTGITETGDRLYVHTLNSQGLAWLPR